MVSNITNEEMKALHNLEDDHSLIVLNAYKGVVLVIIYKNMYIKKSMALFNGEDINHEHIDQTKSIHTKVVSSS